MEPVTSTVYEPSVAIVTTITGLLSLSTTVNTLPLTVNVVASPLLVIPCRLGWSALKSIWWIASEPTSSGTSPVIT
ncbi:hypothetical protein CIK00_20605 [Photobacterium carnosum]|uniref:Uncharacterized protein n=1 Tax=Photobacterium carnosum TaxID=2023717 RepID=A0A2N4ULX9_9GAMM|nr:hypothetical protein CIK00_20605 [Photobacterium carnosum]